MGDLGTSEAPDDPQYSRVNGAVRSILRHLRTPWTPPEIVAAVLVASSAFAIAGGVVAQQSVGGGGGWREGVERWTFWADDPWVATSVVVASLVAWYVATTVRNDLFGTGDSEIDVSQDAESDNGVVAKLWNRERRALVIAGLAALFGAVTAIAVILLVVVSEWSIPGATIIVYPSRIAVALDGLATLVPAVATLVIFRHVQNVWRNLNYADDTALRE
jgi:hypothetical protein